MSFVFVTQNDMQAVKQRLNNGTGKRIAHELRYMADESMADGPFSVTYYKSPAASGDPHDYYSIGSYWWPDEKNPDGPYIRHDGLKNRNAFCSHKDDLITLCKDVMYLASAAYFLDEKKYADKAALLLKVWYIDKETIMNPNLNHAQAIKGICDGRGIGIIDSRQMMLVVHALGFLEELGGYSEVVDGVKAWFSQYIDWLITSKHGQEESCHGNNHTSWYFAQLMSFASLTGRIDLIDYSIERFKREQIPTQIVSEDGGKYPRGSFPLELERTKTLSYSLFNLSAWGAICELAYLNGTDLWHYKTPDGKGIELAIDYLLPFVDNPYLWRYEQIEPRISVDNYAFHLAAKRLGRSDCAAANEKASFEKYLIRINSHIGPLALL